MFIDQMMCILLILVNITARLLVQRLERAQNVLIVAEEAYAKLLTDLEGKTSIAIMHDIKIRMQLWVIIANCNRKY